MSKTNGNISVRTMGKRMKKKIPFKADNIINFLYDYAPRTIWEMDIQKLQHIRILRDGNGRYLWTPEPGCNYKQHPGYLMGRPITISKKKCFQIRYIFDAGSDQKSIVVKYHFDKSKIKLMVI